MELIEFVDGSTDTQLLVKVVDVSQFIKHSFERLEKMASANVSLRTDIYISNKLRPFVLDTSKTIQLVNNIEMLPPSEDIFNVFDMRFLKDKDTHVQSQLKASKQEKEVNEVKEIKEVKQD